MPRAEQSVAGRILKFFQSAPLESASLVLGLSQEAVRERQKKSAEAKARVSKPAGATAVPAVVKRLTAPKKKAAPKTKTKKPKDVPLPLDATTAPGGAAVPA